MAEPRTVEATLGRLVEAALAEDVGEGDWTTLWTVDAGSEGVGEIVAKEGLVVAGVRAAGRVFRAVDPGVDVGVEVADGGEVEPGGVVLRVRGSERSILTAERTALNFLGRLSGVASLTRRFVRAVEDTGARIVDTRKTTPGWRALEKAAVVAGGGENHRMGLDDMVLIKENHIAAAGGIGPAVARVRASNDRGLAVEVEVEDLEGLEAALDAGVDRVLLDNMAPETLERAVARVRAVAAAGKRPEVEASGNVTLETVLAVAETGVDLISVGGLTHSAPASDLSLLLRREAHE